MFKKTWINIKTLFHLFFRGLHQADKVAFGSKEESLNKNSSFEQQQEQDCVWNDVLKGELTQRVKDLRYSTSHAVRESTKYQYIGNGVVQKKSVFSYKGKSYNPEGYEIVLVQDNSCITQGVYQINPIKEYIIKLRGNYRFKYNIDSYTKKIVVRQNRDNGELYMDVYFSDYLEKYNNEHKFVISEIKKVFNGETRSDFISIKEISFTTSKAFGDDDGVSYKFKVIKFLGASKFDGNSVFTFKVNEAEKFDLINLVYDEKSAEKYNTKAPRDEKKSTINYVESVSIEEEKRKNDEFYRRYKTLLDEFDD
jgi:hypothetical protein